MKGILKTFGLSSCFRPTAVGIGSCSAHHAERLRGHLIPCSKNWRFFPCTALLLGLISPALVQAFPPAPFYTVFGDVRDHYGVLLPPDGASIILSSEGREIVRQSLVDGDRGYNYLLRLRLELDRPDTQSYSSLALSIGGDYTLSVAVDGFIYLPIEMSSPRQTGNPADRQRLDLTLGLDSDSDGLPDAWEEAQLFHGGILPGLDGWDLSLINPAGDFDQDGLTNRQEYLIGTYATDNTSYLWLKVAETFPGAVRMEFYAFFGRLYALQASTDLVHWTPVPLALENPETTGEEPQAMFMRSVSTGVISIFTVPAGERVIYRLVAR